MQQIPIYNYWKISDTGDLRYMIISDVFNLPEISEEEKKQLTIDYFNLIKDTETKGFIKIQTLYFDLLQSLFDWLTFKDPGKQQKNNNLFNLYLRELDFNYKKYKYNEKIYLTSKDLYTAYKADYLKEHSFEDLLYDRIQFFNYNTLDCEKRHEWDIYKEMPVILEILGHNVDEFKCSAFKYFKLLERIQFIMKSKEKREQKAPKS